MTFRRRFRIMRRRTARALRPHRVLASVTLVVAMGVTVALLLLVVSQNAVRTPGQSAAKSNTPMTSTPTTANLKSATPTTRPVGVTVPLGVYAGPGSPVAATAFSADAGAPVPYAFDYIDGTTWQSISNPMWFVQQWGGSGFQMIWGVPMLPSTGGFTLATGATGAYNAYFSQLAYTLVDHGLANSVIMLGWDPEDATFPWAARTAGAAADYVSYWRQIVTAMRAVADEQFQFAWDSAPDSDPVLPPALYPGNSYVNIVATDAFDVGAHGSPSSWSAIANETFGPDWFATFAANHNKPLMIAKWGVVPTSASGGGDNATFVNQFLRWADERHLFTAVTWDYGSWAVTGGSFPRAAAMLHAVAEAGAVAPIARTVDS
jgi:hypothetical protein